MKERKYVGCWKMLSINFSSWLQVSLLWASAVKPGSCGLPNGRLASDRTPEYMQPWQEGLWNAREMQYDKKNTQLWYFMPLWKRWHHQRPLSAIERKRHSCCRYEFILGIQADKRITVTLGIKVWKSMNQGCKLWRKSISKPDKREQADW